MKVLQREHTTYRVEGPWPGGVGFARAEAARDARRGGSDFPFTENTELIISSWESKFVLKKHVTSFK
jgi:hypothetical protein